MPLTSRAVPERVVTICLLLLLGAAGARAQGEPFEPVTDEMLLNPDPADWLHWRRTLDGWGFWHDRLVTY